MTRIACHDSEINEITKGLMCDWDGREYEGIENFDAGRG